MTSSGRAAAAGSGTLRRIVGPFTVLCVGAGGAIGSGVFRAPGEAAAQLSSPWMILLVWLAAGGITLLQSLVTAELATRFPRAGGEYQFLKEAYGEFAAFFFGWSFTIFIVGGGAGTIAAAFGEFAAELLGASSGRSAPMLGCAAIAGVVLVNCAGLRTGAVTQNVLTILKSAGLFAIALGALWVAGRVTPLPPAPAAARPVTLEAFLLALMPVFWSYTGATDSAKLAEEVRDVHRSLPLALVASVFALTALYLAFNYALLCAVSPAQMAGRPSVPALAFANVPLGGVRESVLLVSALICLGSMSSMFLANVRVIYALARDGLTFRILGRMSAGQQPVASLAVAGLIACLLVLNRRFERILAVYFLASTVLFGLNYASVLIFRLRDRQAGQGFPVQAFRTPLGVPVAVFLVVVEAALAVSIVRDDIRRRSADSLWTLAVLAALALLYVVWKRFSPGGGGEGEAPAEPEGRRAG